jgi:hypothetical protein
LRVIGNVPTPSDLPYPETFDGEYGDAFVVGTAEPFNVWVWTRPDPNSGHPNDYWLNIGPIAIEGPVGPQGPQGERGPIGQSTKWRVGSGDPTVMNDDKEHDLYLRSTNGNVYECVAAPNTGLLAWVYLANIKGPIGPQGPRGLQGEVGPQGPQGEKGNTGDVGGFINIRGILTNIDQLPTPTTLNNLSVGYLVGTTKPYDLYIQVGETSETAAWTNTGPFNAATLVFVNGEAQNVWNADTKVDKSNVGLRLYGTAGDGSTFMYRYDSDVVGNSMVRRTVEGQIRCADPHPNHKEDVITMGFLKDNSVYWPNVSSGTIPVKNTLGYVVNETYAISADNYSIAQRDNYGNLKAKSAPVLGSTSTSNTYDSTKVSTMGNMFEHANFSTQIRKINTSSLTSYKTLSTYGIYEFYIPEGSYIHAGGYAVNGATTNTKLVSTGGTMKIVYTKDFMIIEGYGSDNYQFESIYVPKTDGSYGKYAV